MTLSDILKDFDPGLSDDELATLVQKALASPEMDAEQFGNVLDSLGELDWVGSAFAPSLKYLIEYIESHEIKVQSSFLTSLAWSLMVFCETTPIGCKPEFKQEFEESLSKSNRLFADCFCETHSIYCLIGMAASTQQPKAARVLFDLQSESV
jgi:hypothetical protein